ncbi:MAG TPA: hypothetical protein VG796_26440 [Verrucomicrobiales bacterium]|nr:hypothetical protein [Verrucomicrobiales bacterium]
MSESHQRTAAPGTLESAARFLRGSLSADRGTHAGHSRRAEIERQFDRLYRWAKEAGCIADGQKLKHARPGGNEHRILHDRTSGRVWKFTSPGKAGLTCEATIDKEKITASLVDATPLEYLERLLLQNEHFGDDIELEAIVIHAGQPCIATSQSFIKGTAASMGDIERTMHDLGFLKSPHGKAFYRPADNLAVWDAHEENFLNSGGIVVPVDLICMTATNQMVELLGF